MPSTSESPLQRIARIPGRIEALRYMRSIGPEHLKDMNRVELYAVITEHWPKCTADTRLQLTKHKDGFVRKNACEMDALSCLVNTKIQLAIVD